MCNCSIRLRKALKSRKKLKFSKCTLGMKTFPKCVETLRRDRAMPKDTGELIFKKSINLCSQPIFSYISSFGPFPRACHIYYFIFFYCKS